MISQIIDKKANKEEIHISSVSMNYMGFAFEIWKGRSIKCRGGTGKIHGRFCDGIGCDLIVDDLYVDIILALKKAKLISYRAPFLCCGCYERIRQKKVMEILKRSDRKIGRRKSENI